MEVKKLCSFIIFELLYLLVLAFLPSFLAVREITYIVLTITSVVVAVALYKYFSSRCVAPEGRVLVITGCDTGFGHACVRRFDQLGYTVIAGCYDLSSEGSNTLRSIASDRMHIINLDITNESSIQSCIAKVNAVCEQRGLWALINNAGVMTYGNVEFCPMDEYRKAMEVNLFGVIQMTKMCLPHIRASKGRIINISGTGGQLSLPGQSAFCIAKFGLEAFGDSLRLEMKQFGVKVITVRPGNFMGSTGMLNKAGLERAETLINKMKEVANDEVLAAYGNDYLDSLPKQLLELSKSSASNLMNMVDAIDEAVTNLSPMSSYLVDGGNQLLDLGNTLLRLQPYLPISTSDQLLSKLYNSDAFTDEVANKDD